MARIIIGVGAGYLLGLFFVAISTVGRGGTFTLVLAALFKQNSGYMLACVAVGAVMGWAWHSIAVDTDPKDD
tara:strand:+ start:181 stop:396 length:216 start_codon:yes stop_codon:yes gene_type:complete